MSKLTELLDEFTSTIKESREEIARVKKENADEMNKTVESVFNLFDEVQSYVDTINDDSDTNRVVKYIEDRMDNLKKDKK